MPKGKYIWPENDNRCVVECQAQAFVTTLVGCCQTVSVTVAYPVPGLAAGNPGPVSLSFRASSNRPSSHPAREVPACWRPFETGTAGKNAWGTITSFSPRHPQRHCSFPVRTPAIPSGPDSIGAICSSTLPHSEDSRRDRSALPPPARHSPPIPRSAVYQSRHRSVEQTA